MPLGKKQVPGLVIDKELEADKYKTLKEILNFDQEFPVLNSARIKWLNWLSHYYYYPIGLVADLSFPPLEFKKKKNLEDKKQNSIDVQEENIVLNKEQQASLDSILEKSDFQTHLIYGVTGSGKTEIYKKLADHILKLNKQILILVPEIFLTPQLVDRFAKSFPDQVAVLHSQLTPRKKTDAWESLIKKEKNILIGTRSSLFCPLPDLAMIVIDEEHDSSFKQEEKFRYHARDSAIMLAKEMNIPIVLGSATPSLSSWHQAQKNNYKLHLLKKRAFAQDISPVQIVDLKTCFSKQRPYWLTDDLFLKMQEILSKGDQVALFLNRRGVAHFLMCFDCGHVVKCPNCDISLTLHAKDSLLCHYCSYTEHKIDKCPSCKSDHWIEKGLGTESIEKSIKSFFPDKKILRADRDSINSRKEMEEFINTVEAKKADIIIGTQMISKGLDFPSVQLVGLLMADMGFHLPDFRATEKSFQILLQMSGRAGRRSKGHVILQTFNPEHSSLRYVESQDYPSFAKEELAIREKLFYPPFCRLCLLEIDSLKEKEGEKFAFQMYQKLTKQAPSSMRILGPSPAPLFKIKNRYRYQILIKSPDHSLLQSFLDHFLKSVKEKPFVRLKVDRDPGSML